MRAGQQVWPLRLWCGPTAEADWRSSVGLRSAWSSHASDVFVAPGEKVRKGDTVVGMEGPRVHRIELHRELEMFDGALVLPGDQSTYSRSCASRGRSWD